MAFSRVINFIRRHEETAVYIQSGTVRCAHGQHKLVKTVLNNKGGCYMLVGVYTCDVSELAVAQDLEACGVRE